MASFDFYALKEDIREVITFLFAQTDCRIFESYSIVDQELREFRSFHEIASTFQLGVDPHGQGNAVLLQLWSPTVMGEMEVERIILKVPGQSFRYRASGVGLIQLYFGGEHSDLITESHYGHWTEKGARQRAVGDVDAVNWDALSQVSGHIQRHIRKLAVAKLRSRPILSAAYEALGHGFWLRYATLKFGVQSEEIKR